MVVVLLSRTPIEARLQSGEPTHRDYVAALADSLRNRSGVVVFEEPSLSPDYREWSKHPHPDVLTVGWKNRKGDQPTFSIYEVKRTRADYFSSLNSGKWQQYLPYANRFFFATPAGLLKLDEVPDEAGLIVYGKSWTTVRAAPYQVGGGLSEADLLLLLHHRHRLAMRVRDRQERLTMLQNALGSKPSTWDNGGHRRTLEQCLGKVVAERLQNMNAREEDLEYREAAVTATIKVLAEGFGLPEDASAHQIQKAAAAANAEGLGAAGAELVRAIAYLLEDLADGKPPAMIQKKVDGLAAASVQYAEGLNSSVRDVWYRANDETLAQIRSGGEDLSGN